MVAAIRFPLIRQLRQCFLRASSLVIPPYRHINLNTYIIPQISHSVNPLILHLFKFLFAHLYFNQLAATSNGHEVEILFSEIDLGIQSHATFCPYRFNTAYTLPCTSDSLPNQLWPYQPGRIEPIERCQYHYSTLANWTMASSKS